jgi:hypothetical protein
VPRVGERVDHVAAEADRDGSVGAIPIATHVSIDVLAP